MADAILGIDYGAARVGVAVAAGGEAPRRLAALPNDAELLPALVGLAEKTGAGVVVVGLPRSLDGDDTAQTAVVRGFAERLRAALPHLTLKLQDEALTSETARQRLGSGAGRRADGLVDQEAAAIILEDYLSGT